MTYAELTGERQRRGRSSRDGLGRRLPGLAMAARTVGSPQIRNRGTIGGNLGSASPAGDCHPSLLAAGAEVEVASVRGTRLIPIDDFFTGVKRSALAPDELIAAVWIDAALGARAVRQDRHQERDGDRGSRVRAGAASGPPLRRHGNRLGGTDSGAGRPGGGVPRRRRWRRPGCGSRGRPLPESVVTEFGALVSAAARPIDDVRGTAAYRRHALAVLARRTLTWAWSDYQRAGAETG